SWLAFLFRAGGGAPGTRLGVRGLRNLDQVRQPLDRRRQLEGPVANTRDEPVKGFARAAVARSLPALLARYPHVTIETLLDRAGITQEVLAERDSLLDFARWVEFAEVAAAETGDSALGAAFAEQLPWRDLGVLGYVILNSPTVGSALRNACRYFALQ